MLKCRPEPGENFAVQSSYYQRITIHYTSSNLWVLSNCGNIPQADSQKYPHTSFHPKLRHEASAVLKILCKYCFIFYFHGAGD